MELKELCEKYSISQTELSRRFGIPLRTVQDWHAGVRKPPVYLPIMIDALISHGWDIRAEQGK